MKTDAIIQKDVLDQLRWEPSLNAAEIQIGISPGFTKTDTEIAAAVATALAWHTAIQEDKIMSLLSRHAGDWDGNVPILPDWHQQPRMCRP